MTEEENVLKLIDKKSKEKCTLLNCPVVKNNIERQQKISKLNELIEKLQKENEELKNNLINTDIFNEYYISKQKIKDKIEELENKGIYQGNGYYCTGAKLILEELLGE